MDVPMDGARGEWMVEEHADAARPAPGPEHARLAPFVGRWRTAGRVRETPDAPAAHIEGTDTYEWLAGGFFLLHRVDVTMGGERVEALEVIGWDAGRGAYFMRSFDSFGNAGVMWANEQGGLWSFAGDTERFTGGFGDGGRTLSGAWERREGAEWIPWMEVRLTKSE
jgi:Protein of unknown function (DUF1579)